ncbi:hypothetical protein, conserved [Eimeria praecox]|uniref:Transmembrane protein n=1 Tax=Eimeria praecox TaxID=51316 RepID=U6G4B0_9EIME|nr:hypothetical protein, conserved [Eimeria praecox]
MESTGESRTVAGSWGDGYPTEDAAVTRTLLFDYAHADSFSANLDSSAVSVASISASAVPAAFSPTETIHETAAPPPPSPQKNNDKKRCAPPVLGAAAMVFVACLALLTFRPVGALKGRKTEASPPREQQQLVRTSDDRALLRQLKELEKLQPLAAWLAGIVDSGESLSALQNFRKCVEGAKQVQEEASSGSLKSWGLPASVMKEALDRGVSELSHLLELTRQHGLSLAQKTLAVSVHSTLSEHEVNAVGQIDIAISASLAFHLENIDIACRAFKRRAAQAEEELQRLPAFNGLEDRQLLRAVASQVEFIKAAHETVEVGKRCVSGLSSTANAVMLSRVVRDQLRIFRECRDLLQEQRALCRGEIERQQSFREDNRDVLRRLEAIESMLDRGDRLLPIYWAKIEQLQRSTDILCAQGAVQQVVGVGNDLQAIVEAVESSIHAIPGVAGAAEASENSGVQRTLKALASRATEEAAAASKRVADILKEVQLGELFSSSVGETQVQEQNEGSATQTVINPAMLKLVAESLEQLEYNSKRNSRQFMIAAAGTPKELAAAVKRATRTTEVLAQEAEMLWLHSQFLHSVEQDMQLSARLARRAAALLGAGASNILGETLATIKLPPLKRKQMEAVLSQMRLAKDTAMSQWTLGDLVVTAATMKDAALDLSLMIEEHYQN